MTVNLSVTNGSASPGTLTIAAGSTTSNAAAVTPVNLAVDTVVSVSSTTFTSGADKGFTLVPGPDLTIPATRGTAATRPAVQPDEPHGSGERRRFHQPELGSPGRLASPATRYSGAGQP